MSQAVLQMIRDFVLAPALLGSSLISLLGVVGLLAACSKRGLPPGSAGIRVSLGVVAGFLLTSLALIGSGTLVAQLEMSWVTWPAYGVCGLCWAGLGLAAAQGQCAERLKAAGALLAGVTLAAWVVDAYVVPALLFVDA